MSARDWAENWKSAAKFWRRAAHAWEQDANELYDKLTALKAKYAQHVHGWTIDTTARCCFCSEPLPPARAARTNVCHACWSLETGEADALANMGCHE